jgi:predicted nucleic-acid-binding protein
MATMDIVTARAVCKTLLDYADLGDNKNPLVPEKVRMAVAYVLKHNEVLEQQADSASDVLAQRVAVLEQELAASRENLASKLVTINELEKFVAENNRLKAEIIKLKARWCRSRPGSGRRPG